VNKSWKNRAKRQRKRDRLRRNDVRDDWSFGERSLLAKNSARARAPSRFKSPTRPTRRETRCSIDTIIDRRNNDGSWEARDKYETLDDTRASRVARRSHKRKRYYAHSVRDRATIRRRLVRLASSKGPWVREPKTNLNTERTRVSPIAIVTRKHALGAGRFSEN